ncbi:hypothetical protein D7Y09_13500 [bacterium 1XD42-1]|nr:hypothetical protein D7X25_13705 [bacterium 1XD42-8]RKJ62560.1 hypothetical protein D7Y09_13500 [bacterium 1XD42-1]
MIIQPENPDQLIALLRSAPLVLYGMGGAGLRIAKWCDENHITYVFADKNAESKRGNNDKLVVLPKCLKKEYPNANIVVSSIIYYEEIVQELYELGINQKQIISYKVFMPQNILWSDLDTNIDWDLMRFRVEMFSGWITEDIQSIVDYGAGKMYLQEYLAPEVKYFPVDYIRRNEQTILCDFNQGVFPDIQSDAAVCSGVLEFIYTPEQLLIHVCEHTNKMIILSYLGIDNFSDIDGRRASAYVSDLSERQIVELMELKGFQLNKKVPDPVNHACMVYMFQSISKMGQNKRKIYTKL